ncbi:hypothetical protein KC901_00395 [Patescibacteria group bacterium]|nr:hypothetical protein [Patescibacteria group bacterium]
MILAVLNFWSFLIFLLLFVIGIRLFTGKKKNPYLSLIYQGEGFEVYEMHKKNADAKPLFSSLNRGLKNIAFGSQEHIKKFIRENKKWLRKDGHGNFFLFTEIIGDEENLFGAIAIGDSNHDLDVVETRSLLDDYLWSAGEGDRFVVLVAIN